MILPFLIFASDLQQAPAATPSPVASSTVPSSVRNYFGCVRELSKQFLSEPDPVAHADSVLSVCEPSLPLAAAELVAKVKVDPGTSKTLANYRDKHGSDLDLTPAVTQRLHDVGRAAAVHILSRDTTPFNANFNIHFNSDGIQHDASAAAASAPTGDRPAAPASGSR